MRSRTAAILAVLVVFLAGISGFAQTGEKMPDETRKGLGLDVARDDPLGLRWLVLHMPKGADLDYHLSGAVYAESYIRNAIEDRLCVDLVSYSLSRPMAGAVRAPVCGKGWVPAARAYQDPKIYDAMVSAFSLRAFVPSAGISVHDHFVDAFRKFAPVDFRHLGEWLDEAASRAAAQNEQYLEVSTPIGVNHTAAISKKTGWTEDFSKLREKMLNAGLRGDVAAATALLDNAENLRRQREHCGGPGEAVQNPKDYWLTPPCKVLIRYLYEIDRDNPKELVFAQALLGFEIASGDARVVGINLAGHEDSYTSMRDYELQMKMIGFLHGLYPKIHISLHAGDLVPGSVPPEERCCHVRLAMKVGQAQRIDNGADIMFEYRPHNLMREEIIAKHAVVALTLTGNAAVMGVSGKNHALPTYLMMGPPLTISTGDEGVLRTDITHEYVVAFTDYGLHYVDLKKMVRTSMEHTFLPGESLWAKPDKFDVSVGACVRDKLGAKDPSAECGAFLQSSEKARQQWELERRLQVFEADP